MHTYLAPWTWDPQEPAWNAPAQAACRGVLDLRSLVSQAATSGDPGYGLFAYATTQTIADSLYLGDSLPASLSLRQKTGIASILAAPVTASTLGAACAELMTNPACYDASGGVHHKPLRLQSGRRVRLTFGGELVIDEVASDETHPAFAAMLAVQLVDYATLRSGGADAQQLRRQTGDLMQRLYGRMGDDLLAKLLPLAYRGDGWAAPQTTYTDDFNRVGEQLDASANWATVTGTASWANVVSNQLEYDAADDNTQSKFRYEQDLSSTDHYALLTVAQLDAESGKQIGVVCRFSASADTGYAVNLATGDNQVRAFKTVAGTRTNLDSDQTPESTPVPGEIKIQLNGSAFSSWHKTVAKHSFTDTAITTGTRAGLHYRRGDSTNVSTLDDFETADLAAGGGSILPMQIQHYYAGAS